MPDIHALQTNHRCVGLASVLKENVLTGHVLDEHVAEIIPVNAIQEDAMESAVYAQLLTLGARVQDQTIMRD